MFLVDMARKRETRDEWQKRVERWKDSGLTAEEFAAETGINAGTLRFWQYKLKKGSQWETPRRRTAPVAPNASSIIELRPCATSEQDRRFEIELRAGRRVHVPASFDPDALRSLLAVLEATS
jgi:transposase-like protein